MSFCIELFCVVTLQYQILVIIAIAYFIIEKKKTAPQPWQAIAQRFCSTGNCRFLYIDKVQFISRFIIFSSSKLPTCCVSKNISLFITTIIIAAITTKIVCIHFVSGVMFIFSCIIFINK